MPPTLKRTTPSVQASYGNMITRAVIGITHALVDSMVAAPDLTSSITHTLRRTYGWVELGCPKEALSELEGLPDVLHASRDVLKLKCKILATDGNWAQLRELSSTSAKYYPTEPTFAENWAWAEHKTGRSEQAYSLLLEASEKFERTWRTNYFLACFAHSIKRADEAAEWLGHAFLLHSAPAQLKELALEEFRS